MTRYLSTARLSCAAALAAGALLGVAQAQIVADPSAPGHQRPTVLRAPNGVPLINIQTPSAAGVSRNRYQRFDVDGLGAILNNSRGAAPTELGGWVGPNPWLATGGARVILNEVNSSDPSRLKGWVEVAGQRAEVVIANPSGIQVNGAGFINASRVTLSTGTPVFNGGALEAWRVQRGQIGIGGAGLDMRAVDHTAILARAVQINAGLWARQLQVVTGANTVDPASGLPVSAATPTGPVPSFALDVGLLGGMYAGQIHLIGTEAGLGVNLQGVVSAEAGDLVLDTQGWLSHSGGLGASGHAQVRAQGPITQQASGLMAGDRLTLNTPGKASLQGELLATQGMDLAGAQLDLHEARVVVQGGLSLAAGASLTTDRAQLQAGAIEARAGSVSNQGGVWLQTGAAPGAAGIVVHSAGLFDNGGGSVLGAGSLRLQTGELRNEALAGRAARIGAGGDLHIQASELHNTSGTAADGKPVHAELWADQAVDIDTQGTLSNASHVHAGTRLSLSAGDIANSGTLEAGTLSATATGRLHNTATGSLLAEQFMVLDADTLDNQGLINVDAGGALHARGDTLNNRSGGAIFADQLAIEARELNNRPDGGPGGAPVIAARESLQLGVQTLNNEDGALIYSGGDMAMGGELYGGSYAIGQAQAVNNLSADIEAMGDLNIAARALSNQRRNVAVAPVNVLDQTARLDMPTWWHWNGKNEFGAPIEGTSNYTRQLVYLLDPSAILSDEAVLTPDGNRVRRLEVALDPSDSVFYGASGAYAGYRGVRERFTVGQAGTVVLYASLRQDGVANPDQVPGAPDPLQNGLAAVSEWQRDTLAYSTAYGRCSSQCSLLVVQPGYEDPQRDLLRSDHTNLVPTHAGLELWRSAHHTAVEDRLNADAGAPAAIRAGGAMRLGIADSLVNRYADILAGAALQVAAPAVPVVNEGATLKRTHSFRITSQTAGLGAFDWTKPAISEVIGQLGGRLDGGQLLSIQAQDLSNTDQGRSTGLAGVGVPGGQPPLRVADSRLFQRAAPALGYLVETDPRFTDQHQWLGSDYLLRHFASEPAATLKRLGDGFYEQKLVREQVAELTGKRFLNEFQNDEAQFRALMDAGLAYAQAFELKPGIALTAEQMAQLTTDLVWLVQQEVVLADGTRTQALVPRLYLRAVPSNELLPSGAVLAGKTVLLDIQRDLVNAGGRIEGDVVLAQAGRDISNIGGLMQARVDLLAKAGRNVTVASPTLITTYASDRVQQSRSELAGVGAMRVTGENGGQLKITAGQDVILQGAAIGNAAAAGAIDIQAGRDVRLQTVEVGSAKSTSHDERNYVRHSQSQELGTNIQGAGDIAIGAGQDFHARAATVDAQGDLAVHAGNNITLEAGRAQSESAWSATNKRSGLVGSKTTEHAQSASSDEALGSALGGRRVTLNAGQDLAVRGSSVIGDEGVTLIASGNVSIEADRNEYSTGQLLDIRKSGLFSSGGSLTLGTQQQSTEQRTEQSLAAASTVGAIKGDVTVVAGERYQQTGSDVLAPGGDVNVLARTIQITEARERQQSQTQERFQQGGISLSVSSPVLTAMQTLSDAARGANKAGDARTQALAAATAGLAAMNTYDAVAANPTQAGGFNLSISLGGSRSENQTQESVDRSRGSTVAAGGNVNLVADGAGADSDILVRGSGITAGHNANLVAQGDARLEAAKDTAALSGSNKSSAASIGLGIGTNGMGITLSASAARGRQAGEDVTHTHTNTVVSAGQAVNIQSGQDTSLRGAVVSGHAVRADVGGDLNIESQQDTSTYTAQQNSAGGSLTVGAGVISGSISASKSNTRSSYTSVTEQSGIRAGDGGFDVVVSGNTDLKGAVISSTDKAVEEGRNSLITGTLASSDIRNSAAYEGNSIGIGVGYGTGEQTVGRGADGPVATGADQVPGLSLPTTAQGWSAAPPLALNASGDASSVTRSGISGANVTVLDEDAQRERTGLSAEEAVAAINTQVTTGVDTSGALAAIFDKEEVEAQFVVAQAFTQELGTFLVNRAREADAKAEEAVAQDARADALLAEASQSEGESRQTLIEQANGYKAAAAEARVEATQIEADWGVGGAYRTLAIAATAAASGSVGAGGAQFIEATFVNLAQSYAAQGIKAWADQMGVPEGSAEHAALHALLGCAGAAANGADCGAGAMGAASAAVVSSLLEGSAETLTQEQKEARKNLIASLVTGVAAASASAAAANTAALIEMENNSNVRNAVKAAINDAKDYVGKKGREGLEKAAELLEKIEIKALVDKQKDIAQYLDEAAKRGGLTEGEIAVLGIIYAGNEALFPTSVLDVLPGGKGVSKSGALIKAGVKAEDAAKIAVVEAKQVKELAPFSHLVQGGGLAAHEAVGGHLLTRHVGKTDADLASRLAAEPRLSAASTFANRQEAEAALAGALLARATDVNTWISLGARGRLIVDAPFNGGAVLQRGAAAASPGTGVRAILEGTGNGGWRIITGFPTL